MSIKEEERIETSLSIEGQNTKGDIRRLLLDEWGKEIARSKYRYFVEILSDGKRMYLERPGNLNQGCDFVIHIEDLFLRKNGNDKPPSHKDLCDDLLRKKEQLPLNVWRNLIDCIEAVHSMTHHEMPKDHMNKINSLAPLNVEQIQLLCKWFFIEQDLTYWSGQGRDKLFDGIKSL